MANHGGMDEALWTQTEQLIGALIEVHRHLGPGLLESAYDKAVARELALRDIAFERQRNVRLTYKGANLDVGFRCDFVVNESVLLELKAVDVLQPIHAAQVITYLRLTGVPVGLLVNFNVRLLKTGIQRLWLDPQRFPNTMPS